MLIRKIAYNTIIAAGARIIGLVLSLIIIGFLTRYLGQSGFGEYATILAFLYFFTVLSDLGIYSICLRDISRLGADEKKIASNAFTLKFFASLFIFSLAPIIVYFFPYSSRVKIGVLIAAFGFWLLSNNQVLIGVFQKYLKIDKLALAEVAGRAFQLSFVIFFIWRQMNFLFIVSAIVIGALVNFGLVFLFSRRYIPISFQFDFSFWRSLFKKSLPLALAIVFSMIYFKLDVIMLSVMKSAAEVGIYSLAYKVLESLLFFPAMFVGLIMPLLSKYAFVRWDLFKRVSQKTLNVLLIFVIPLIIGTFFVSKRAIILIGGEQFIASAGVLNILIVATGIIFLGVFFSNAIIALEKQKNLTYIYGLGAIVNLISNLIFIPRYSYQGAAFTTLATELIVTALMLIVIYQTVNSLPSFKPVFKCILAGLIMALFLYYFTSWNLFILIILSSFIYFLILWLIKGFSTNDILSLIRKEA